VADLAFGAQFISRPERPHERHGHRPHHQRRQRHQRRRQTTGGQSYSEAREGGIFTQLDLAWRDRMYLQLGGRLDKNSAFGEEVATFFNPKVGLSYVISEEDFYPESRSEASCRRSASARSGDPRAARPGHGARR
jgi:outer membrane cobalamin receptor